MEHERGAFKVIRETTAGAVKTESVCTLSGHSAHGAPENGCRKISHLAEIDYYLGRLLMKHTIYRSKY
jgi:hypothetical protein